MRKRHLPAALVCLIALFLAAAQPLWAKVYQTVDQSLSLPVAPLAVAVSGDGNVTFVLGPDGKVLVSTKAGERDEITIGKDFDQIATTFTGDKIVVSSRKTKQLQSIYVDFLKHLTTDGSPFLGNDKAPLVLVSFSDFQCPHCAKLGAVYQQLLEKYPNSLKIVYKYFPLPNHQFSGLAAVAAVAAGKQGKFWQYHDLIYANFDSLTPEKINQFAEKLGLNMPQFQKDMNSQEAKDRVIRDLEEGRAAGVLGTPTLFLNGRMIRNHSLAGIEKMIDETRKK